MIDDGTVVIATRPVGNNLNGLKELISLKPLKMTVDLNRSKVLDFSLSSLNNIHFVGENESKRTCILRGNTGLPVHSHGLVPFLFFLFQVLISIL